MSPFSFIHCIRPVHPRGVGATAGPSVRHVRYSRERARKVFFCLLFYPLYLSRTTHAALGQLPDRPSGMFAARGSEPERFSSKRKVRSEKRKVRSEKSRAVKTDP